MQSQCIVVGSDSVRSDDLSVLVGLLTIKTGFIINVLAGSWQPIPHIQLHCPSLLQGEVFIVTTS